MRLRRKFNCGVFAGCSLRCRNVERCIDVVLLATGFDRRSHESRAVTNVKERPSSLVPGWISASLRTHSTQPISDHWADRSRSTEPQASFALFAEGLPKGMGINGVLRPGLPI